MKKFLPLVLFLLVSSLAEAGSVQFSTYYPAPFGMYDRLRLVPRLGLGEPCDAGTFYYETGVGLRLCDEATLTWGNIGGVWTQDGVNDYIYPTDTATNPNLKVGIGIISPTAKLHVRGADDTAEVAAFVPGADTGAPGTPSLNVGIGTTTPRTRLELDNDGAILATGTFGSGWSEPDLGAGTRLLWYPRKAAFRAGYISGSQWDNINVGNYSVAMGSVTTASGDISTAMGGGTTASNLQSTAMGASTTASGIISTAMGSSTTASGLESTAMGRSTTASGSGSTAMGGSTTASGYNSTAMGFYTTAQAYASTVFGRYNVIAGNSASWVAADPLFVIGNGASAIAPSNAMTVLKNGDVGIGTTAPTAKLHVRGANDTTEMVAFMPGTDTGLPLNTYLNVGIGTATPGYRLHVFANEGDAISTGGPGIFLDDTDITVDGGDDGIFGLRNANTGGPIPGISIGGPGLNTVVMLIDTLNKKVGIGTKVMPTGKLHVQGKDDAAEVVTFMPGADTAAPGTPSLNVGIGTTTPGTNKLEVVGGPIKATGGMILPTCTNAAGDCPAAPVAGQIWLCTDC